MAKNISRREFLKGITGGAGLLGSVAVALGNPLETVKNPASAMEALQGKLGFMDVKLTAQSAYRSMMGVRQVEKPTYEKYIEGDVPRFDEVNTTFNRMRMDKEFVDKFLATPVREWNEWDLEGTALEAGAWFAGRVIGDGTGNYSGVIKKSEEQLPVPDPARMSERIKKVAMAYGADLVGIAPFDERWVYNTNAQGENVEIPWAKYVVVLAVEMDYDFTRYISYPAPGFGVHTATGVGYSRMANVAPMLANYVLGIGYNALAAGNDTGLSIPEAVDAGLGEMGRHNLLITPEYGPRVRLCKVFTDLPLQPDKPIDFGIQRFCELCNKCARACPARAIPFGDRTSTPLNKSNNSGLRKWMRDAEECLKFWRRNGFGVRGRGIAFNGACNECIRVCPWNIWNRPNVGWYYDFMKWFSVNMADPGKSFTVWLYDVLGYGRPIPAPPSPP